MLIPLEEQTKIPTSGIQAQNDGEAKMWLCLSEPGSGGNAQLPSREGLEKCIFGQKKDFL